jgi:MFS family permease
LSPEDSYRGVLTNRNFLALWFGQGLASLGQAILYVTLALYVYELTESAEGVSVAIALELLPWVIVGPIAGIFADRLNRKLLLVGGYIMQASLVALLPFADSLGQVYVLIFLSSLSVPVSQITRAAALPSVTGIELFMRGSSLDIAALNIAGVLGPVLAGWLVGVIGTESVFLVVAGCLLAAAVLSLFASIPRPTITSDRRLTPGTVWRDIRDAASFLASSKVFRFLLLLNFVLTLAWTAPDVAIVVYITEALELGGQEFGLLHATMSLSIAITVYILGHYSGRLPRGRFLVGGVVLAGLGYTLILIRPELVGLLVIWAISGIGWGAHWLMDQTLWAEVTADETRGRVFSLAEAAVSLMAVITALFGGWLISRLGPVPALAVIGFIIAFGAIALSFRKSEYRAVSEIKPGL